MDLPVVPADQPLNTYQVTCIRLGGSPGRLMALVVAATPEEAVELIAAGEVTGVGLGWHGLLDSVVEVN